MLVGYNNNINYKGKTYHIQTEDSGASNPVIVTLLYSKGAIIASKKTSYSNIKDEPEYKEKVKKLMREQHRDMIKELLAGKYTGDSTEEVSGGTPEKHKEEAETKDQITRSLDDILLNYIIKRK